MVVRRFPVPRSHPATALLSCAELPCCGFFPTRFFVGHRCSLMLELTGRRSLALFHVRAPLAQLGACSAAVSSRLFGALVRRLAPCCARPGPDARSPLFLSGPAMEFAATPTVLPTCARPSTCACPRLALALACLLIVTAARSLFVYRVSCVLAFAIEPLNPFFPARPRRTRIPDVGQM
jgi:hypothetical protein